MNMRSVFMPVERWLAMSEHEYAKRMHASRVVPEEGVEPTHSCEDGILSALTARKLGRNLAIYLRFARPRRHG
jgi:hypothetical protein